MNKQNKNIVQKHNKPNLMTTPVVTRKRSDQTASVYVTLGRKNDWTEIWLFRFDFDTSER